MGELADLAGHIPVLLHEVVDGLVVRPGGSYVDATVGGGGHAEAILEASAPDGRLLGLDRDPEAAARAAERLTPFGERARIVARSYTDLAEVTAQYDYRAVDGILFDLGFSSWQIDNPARGFSFSAPGPLDMRFNPQEGLPTAGELVNRLPEEELADIIYHYGEETRSRRIAAAIVAARPITDTLHLAEVVANAVGRRGRIHPATLTFQALRIAVNDELAGLERTLPQAVDLLRPGGRLAVITFHSLEDRLVKQYFRREASDCICPPELPVCRCEHRAILRLVTRKPIRPSAREVAANPRSRSAKLRIAERIQEGDRG